MISTPSYKIVSRKSQLRLSLERLCIENELHFVGCSGLDLHDDYQKYCDWIAKGLHAQMDYLARNQELRKDPRLIFPEAKSSLVFALNYRQNDTLKSFVAKKLPWIAQYARSRDYHRELSKRIKLVLESLKKSSHLLEHELSYRICVDSVPLLERAVAVKSKRGFIGKNGMFIHDRLGSLILLGVVLIDQDWTLLDEENAKIKQNHCGSCRRCSVHCPTGALDEEYVLDARKCISYWSIEHKGEVPKSMWPYFSDYLFGCDLCQIVCPFNKKRLGESPPKSTLQVRLDREADPAELFFLDESGFLSRFAGTPVMRAGLYGIKRNALIAMFVGTHPRFLEALRACFELRAVDHPRFKGLLATAKSLQQECDTRMT